MHASLADELPGGHDKIFEVAAQLLLQLNQAQTRLVRLLRLVDLPDDQLDLRKGHRLWFTCIEQNAPGAALVTSRGRAQAAAARLAERRTGSGIAGVLLLGVAKDRFEQERLPHQMLIRS